MRKLWYDKPAECWNEALPLGNGRIGAMFYGNPVFDRLQLNEDTLWSGQPHKDEYKIPFEKIKEIRRFADERKYYEAEKSTSDLMPDYVSDMYLPYGSLNIEIQHGSSDVTDFRRELDLETSVAHASYRMDGILIEKTAFVSQADDVLVYNFKSERDLALRIYDACIQEHTVNADGTVIKVKGRCPTDVGWIPRIYKFDDKKESVPFCSMTKVIAKGNAGLTYGGAALQAIFSKDITIIFSIKTGFNGYDKMPMSEGRDYEKECAETLEKASKYTFDELLERHIKEYKKYFDRASFTLEGENYDNEPTDERIIKAGNGRIDNGLVTLLFDYARYLTISSSKEGTQPTNLQGIWNEWFVAPWHSNYTTNINTEMNYWHVETVNLPEFHMPLFKMLKELKEKGNIFGIDGWCAFHNSDLWRYNYPSTKDPRWGFCASCGFWLCRHIWEHYTHTQDVEFLKEYYDIIEGAIDFLNVWMYEDKDGNTVVCPSTSPENQYVFEGNEMSVTKGTTFEMSIIYDLFDKAVKMGEILGKDVSAYKATLSKIKPFAIGEDGRLLEWNEPFEETEPGHRHISHLYGFFPSDIMGKEYSENVRKTLDMRLANGGGHTGWSNAWNANVFARLGDGEGVIECIRTMFKKSIYPNMLDKHPPFQIDGNFGICSAICEALMQSHTGKVELLPALPKEWKHGQFKGFIARNGEKVDYKW